MKYFSNPGLGCVIITSDEPWSEVWMSQLHYAYQLSRRMNVVFVGPPEPWSIKTLFRWRYTPRRYNDRLMLIRYLNTIPLAFGRLAVFLNDKINELILRKHIRNTEGMPELILWRFDPFRSMYLFDDKKSARQIFHVIDPIAGCDLDVPLARRAELVIITSPKFIDHYKALNNNVVQISQGIDIDFYRAPAGTGGDAESVSENSVLLLGSFTDDIDYLFLKKLAGHITANLVLIGPKKISKPEKLKHFDDLLATARVHWLGAMEPSRFMGHLQACRVGIISYDNNNNVKNQLRSPLKAIGYLAAGKCIISNIDCEIPMLTGKAIYIVEDESSYFQLMDKCFEGELLFDKKAVDEYLASVDYNYLISLIFSRLGMQLPEKV